MHLASGYLSSSLIPFPGCNLPCFLISCVFCRPAQTKELSNVFVYYFILNYSFSPSLLSFLHLFPFLKLEASFSKYRLLTYLALILLRLPSFLLSCFSGLWLLVSLLLSSFLTRARPRHIQIRIHFLGSTLLLRGTFASFILMW